MPYPEWSSFCEEDRAYMKYLFDNGKCLAICQSLDDIHICISCWTASNGSKTEEQVCLYKHLGSVGLCGEEYTLVGISQSGLYYGENLMLYLKEFGGEIISSFRNLWAIRITGDPATFIIRSVI